MKISLASVWENVRTSFWFVPTLMTLGAIALSGLTLWLDERFVNMDTGAWWIYSGGASGARSILAVISGSMITVTSVVFSITIVTLTLASGQFGSRVLRNFMRDTGNQVVLGTFIATFVYSLLILRSVRGEGENEFIPYSSVTVGVLLVFLSVGVLIYFIHHVSTKIQAESIVSAIFEETTEAVDNQFPQQLNDERKKGINRQQSLQSDLPESFYEQAYEIKAGSSNYLQVVEYKLLLKLAEKHNLILKIPYKPGDFIIRGSIILLVWPAHQIDDALHNKLHNNFILGVHQTLTQNAEYGIQQLVEIAVRALSPGINDPFTAVNCIDRLAAILCQVARKQFPSSSHCDTAGKLRVKFKTTTFEGYVDTAFNQIRQNSKSSPAVMIKLMEAIYQVMSQLSLPEQFRILHKHAEMIKNTGQNNLKERQDQEDLQSRYERIVKRQEV